MTILSKKKTLQGKSEVESSDPPPHHSGSHSHGIAVGSLPNHTQVKQQAKVCVFIVVSFDACL